MAGVVARCVVREVVGAGGSRKPGVQRIRADDVSGYEPETTFARQVCAFRTGGEPMPSLEEVQLRHAYYYAEIVSQIDASYNQVL